MGELRKDLINEFVRRRLRALRREKRLSVRQAAKLSGIPESSYSCLEGGHYRITLQNLQRILAGLGVGIEQVWPTPYAVEPLAARSSTVGPASVPDTNSLNYFRFHELVTLSEARQAALLIRRTLDIRVVYTLNVDEAERRKLCQSVQAGLAPGWKTYRKGSGDVEIFLCLKDSLLGDRLRRLLTLYMDLWLATFFAQPPS